MVAKAFFRKAIKNNGKPEKVKVDKSGRNKCALDYFNRDVTAENEIEIREIKDLNNMIAQGHIL
jgi:putative transposase